MSIAIGVHNQWSYKETCSLIAAPYAEGMQRIQMALLCLQNEKAQNVSSYKNSKQRPLFERVCLFAEGLLLYIPLINMIMYAAMRYLLRNAPEVAQKFLFTEGLSPRLYRHYPAATEYPAFDTFRDSDILQVHQIVRVGYLSDGRSVAFTSGPSKKKEKAVLLLQTDKSHPNQACLAMLMLDRKKQPDVKKLDVVGTPAYSSGREMLLKERLVEVRRFARDPLASADAQLEQLKLDVKSQGPVMVDLWWRTDNFNHFVIVDKVSDDLQKVRIRDPQHGWDITIKASSFMTPYLAGGVDIRGVREVLPL